VIQSEWLKRNYRMQATFGPDSLCLDRARVDLKDFEFHACKYNIYRRVDAADSEEDRRKSQPL
jgi:hypothetical protein